MQFGAASCGVLDPERINLLAARDLKKLGERERRR
jgi:hypothetical protein